MAGMLEKLELDKTNLMRNGIEIEEKDGVVNFAINSYLAFEYLISKVSRESIHYDCGWNKFYRGVSNETYDLICSLCFNNLENQESEIINNLYSRAPAEFSECKTDFEMIALMQHYGLPTRLLDFTRNPLIALWFACQPDINLKNANGAVYLAFSSQNTPQRIINQIFKIALADRVDKIIGIESIMSKEEILQYVYDSQIRMNRMLFLDAPIIDLRERNQQAVFLLGVNDIMISDKFKPDDVRTLDSCNFDDVISELYSEGRNIRIEFGKIHCYKKSRDSGDILKIIIPNKLKRTIIDELAMRGIGETFIYPSLDNYCKEIKSKAKQIFDAREEEYSYLNYILDQQKITNGSI